MADGKISSFTAQTTPLTDDMYVLETAAGATKKIVPANLAKLMPGYVMGYAEITTSATSTATVQASATTVLTAPSITFDGTTAVWITVSTPRLSHATTGLKSIRINIWEDSTDIGTLILRTVTSATEGPAQQQSLHRTPAAGAKVYTARMWLSGADTATLAAGDGTGANLTAAWISVVRA